MKPIACQRVRYNRTDFACGIETPSRSLSLKKDHSMIVALSFFRIKFPVAMLLLALACVATVNASAFADGSAFATTPKAAVSRLATPTISNIKPKAIMAHVLLEARDHHVGTIDDQLNTPLSKTRIVPRRGVAHPEIVNPVTVTSPVQTTDYTLPNENATGNTTTLPAGDDGFINVDPAWAPSESFIVFSSKRTADGLYHLFAISSTGDPTTLVQLTNDSNNERWPALASDSQIAYCQTTGGTGPYSLDVAQITTSATGSLQILSSSASQIIPGGVLDCERPSYSGDVVAFAARTASNVPYHIYTYIVSSATLTELTGGTADEENPALSPVSSLVAFDSSASGYSVGGAGNPPLVSNGIAAMRQIYVCRLGGSDIVQLTTMASNAIQPAWAYAQPTDLVVNPGSYIFFSSDRNNGNYNIWNLPVTPASTGPCITGEEPGGTAINLSTSDPVPPAAPTTKSGAYSNFEPAVSAYNRYHQVLYFSDRFLVNNLFDNPVINADSAAFPAPDNNPTNTKVANGGDEILGSSVADVTPPSLLRYSDSEIVHVEATVTDVSTTLSAATAAGATTIPVASTAGFKTGYHILIDSGAKQEQGIISLINNANSTLVLGTALVDAHADGVNIRTTNQTRYVPAGQTARFVVRVSDRETGVGQVYLQIKDPNSKYQQTATGVNGLEHKVFSVDPNFHSGLGETDSFGFFPSLAGENIDTGNMFYTAGSGQAELAATTAAVSTQITINFPQGLDDNAISGGGNQLVGDVLQFQDGQIVQVLGVLGKNLNATTPNATLAITPLTATESVIPPAVNPITCIEHGNFDAFGQEFDCQAIMAGTGGQVDATNAANFLIPPYLAGNDDTFQEDATSINAGAGGGTLWLPMTPVATTDPLYDENGGILYEATWQTPTLPSDYYVDVIAFDNANIGAQNWEIYDNVWGFTTATFQAHTSPGGILLVNDYMLPQKFFNHGRFGSFGPVNKPINYFGAESYLTDIDVNYLDNNGALAALPSVGWDTAGTAPQLNTLMHRRETGSYAPYYANTLGVNSYFDGEQFGLTVGDSSTLQSALFVPTNQTYDYDYSTSALVAPSQTYDIWRILCRGPIPSSILNEYAPQVVQQPADVFVTGATAKSVLAAPSCVIWDSPFAGDEFADNGTIADPTTQTALTSFVQEGGRLYVCGIDVGYALTQNGSETNNFYANVLNATFSQDDLATGNSSLTLTGGGKQTDYISYDAFINNEGANYPPASTVGHANFKHMTPGPQDTVPNWSYGPPASQLLNLAFDPLGLIGITNERSDASLDDGGLEQNEGFIDGFTPIGTPGSANGPIAPIPSEYQELIGSGANDGLVYTVFPGPKNANYGYGISAYSSFGLESMSQQVYSLQDVTPAGWLQAPPVVFAIDNQRTDLMHNVVCFLRTGTITGTLTNTQGGAAVSSAEVELVLQDKGGFVNPPASPITFTGLTDAFGNFSIAGVPAGRYNVNAYKAGTSFQHPTFSAIDVHGGDKAYIAIQVAPALPGSLTVTVVDAVTLNPIAGAVVKAVETLTGTPTYTGTTGTDGKFTQSPALAGDYNVTASANGYGAGTVTAVVTTGQNTLVTVLLGASPGLISGTVKAAATLLAIPGATVTLSQPSPSTFTPIVETTNANGAYTIPSVTPGTYTLTAAASGFIASAVTVTISAAETLTENFLLNPAPVSTIRGNITSAITGAGINAATVVLTPVAPTTGVAVTTTTNANGLYAFLNVTPGKYTVTASKTGYASNSAAVTTVVNTTSHVNIALSLPPTATIYGLVSQAANGTAIGGATITVTSTTRAGVTYTTTTSATTFTDPLGKPANYTVAGLAFDTYKVALSGNGFPAQPAQTVTADTGDLQVNFAVTAIHTFTAGLKMISVPYEYAGSGLTLSQILGYPNPKMAAWQPLQSLYVVTPTSPANTFHLGQGYWIRFPQTTGLLLAGTPASGNVSLSLSVGWTMIGYPFTSGTIPLDSIVVHDQTGAQYSWIQATGQTVQLIGPSLYTYDSTVSTSYQSVSDSSGVNALSPWVGYWIQAYSPVTITLTAP